MKHIRQILAGIFIACLVSLSAFAASTGDLSGTATDTSGAVVVGAKVTVRSLANGATRETTTNDEGQFSVPQLEIGGYEVSIEKSGFKIYKGTTLVRSGENSRITAKLDVGTADSVVTVDATVATLDVATAQISDSLETAEILSLPNQARDPVAYATLSPGTVPVSKDNPFLGTGSFNSNGSRGRANNIVVDNIISSDISTTGEAGTGTFSYDGVQEFKLISNNFDAEFGRNSGSQVQIITKSGGNQIHGSAYIFHQNNFFNARAFFNNTDANGNPGPGPINHFVQNQGGFTLGGPVWKDHTFLFGHFEVDKTRGSSGSSVAAVPQPGDVATITDPTSLALFNRYGAPSSPSGTIASPAPNVDNGHSWSVRLDQNLHSGRDSFFVRYGKNPDISNSGLTFINTNLPGFGAQFAGQAVNLSAGYTMSPTSNIVNQARFGFGRTAAAFVANTPFPPGPEIDFGDVSGLGVSNIIPQGRTQKTLQYGDTLSWVHGRHTFKFGTDIINYNTPSFFDANTQGTFTFNSFADFAAGSPVQFTQRFANTTFRVNKALDVFGFVQDDFRVTNTLTLNLGFRLESSGGVSEQNNVISNIDPNNNTPIGILGTGPLGGVDVGGDAFHRNYNPAPRVGAAWNPGRGKLVIRGGYGIAYDYIFLNPITNLRFAAPFVYSITIPSTGFTGANSYANVVAGTSAAQATAQGAIGNFPSTFANFGSMSAVDQNLQNPRNQQWSGGVEYQVMKALTLKGTYVGTRSDHLQVSVPLNFTNPALRPAPLTSNSASNATLTAIRAFVAGESPSSATAINNRIDPRFNGVTQVQSVGNSDYNALQLEAIGKFRDLTFNANYTWSHSIDDVSDVLAVLVNDSATIASPNQPLSFNRGNSEFDLRQRMNLSYTYNVPFARHLNNGALKSILDGWQISNIFSTQTGFPTTIFAGSISVLNIDKTLAAGKNVFQTVSDSQLLGTGITWVNGDATQVHPSAFSTGVNTSSVSQPFVGQQGTSGRNHLRLDGLTDLDASLGKSFKVFGAGDNPKTLQLRWEVFNVLNHPNLSGFTNTFTSPIFGQYTTTATNMRQMQVAARFVF